MAWGIFEYHDSTHVAPIVDSIKHEISADCECKPKYENGVYIHNKQSTDFEYDYDFDRIC